MVVKLILLDGVNRVIRHLYCTLTERGKRNSDDIARKALVYRGFGRFFSTKPEVELNLGENKPK